MVIRAYTENEINFIMNNSHLGMKEIAKILNRTKRGVQSKYNRVKYSRLSNNENNPYQRNFNNWTPEEISFFKIEIQSYDFDKLSLKMKRTPEALKKKARQIYGTNKLSEIRGNYTAYWLSSIFNLHPSTIHHWIKASGFPHKKIRIYKTRRGYSHTYIINLNKVFTWLKKQIDTNPHFYFDFRKVNKQKYLDEAPAFYNEWFVGEIDKGTLISAKKDWTPSEERLLVKLINSNKNIDEICSELNRTQGSVRKKIRFLKVGGILTKGPVRKNSKDLVNH